MAVTDYGIKTINSAGQTQVDCNYITFQNIKTSSASITVGSQWVDTNLTSSNLGVSEIPLIGLRADASYYNCHWGFDSASGIYKLFKCWPEGSFTVYYCVFSVKTATDESYGVALYDSNGVLTFNSGSDPFKIVNIFSDSAAKGDTNNHTVSDAVNNYFILTNPSWEIDGSGTFLRGFKRTSTTNVRVSTYQFSVVTGASSNWENSYNLIEIKNPLVF